MALLCNQADILAFILAKTAKHQELRLKFISKPIQIELFNSAK